MKIKVATFILLGVLIAGGAFFYVQNLSYENSVLSVASPTPTPTPTPTITPLLCFNESTKDLRSSDVTAGCMDGEQSLGASPIDQPTERPSELNPLLMTRFLAAQAAGKNAGFPLHITSGYRSYALQERLFANAVKKYGTEAKASKWVLPANISHHPWGLALDINYPNDPVSTKWLEVNGYIYGLCRAYENEWWHFEGITAPGEPCPSMLTNASVEEE